MKAPNLKIKRRLLQSGLTARFPCLRRTHFICRSGPLAKRTWQSAEDISEGMTQRCDVSIDASVMQWLYRFKHRPMPMQLSSAQCPDMSKSGAVAFIAICTQLLSSLALDLRLCRALSTEDMLWKHGQAFIGGPEGLGEREKSRSHHL